MSTPYKCPKGIWTIGYGTTVYPDGNYVGEEDHPVTKYQAFLLLLDSVSNFEDKLNNFCEKHQIVLNNNQFSALISFFYNLGFNLKEGTKLYNSLVRKQIDRTPEAMALYVNIIKEDGSRVQLPGLVKRRQAEIDLFNLPTNG
jgi:lysozyme